MAVFAFLWPTVALLCVETGKAQIGKVKAEFDHVAVLVLSQIVTLYRSCLRAIPVVATFSADGTRVPGGYVVPVGGDITFTCKHNGSSIRSLFWQVIIINRTATTTPTTALFLGNEPGFSTTATKNTENPVNLTIHNLQLINNGSTVLCQLENEGSPSVILVEGKALATCTPQAHAVLSIQIYPQ